MQSNGWCWQENVNIEKQIFCVGLTKKWHPQRMKQTNFYILYIYTLIPRGAVNFNHLNKKNVLSEETHLSKWSMNQTIWCTQLTAIVKDLFCEVWYFFLFCRLYRILYILRNKPTSILEPVFLMTDSLYVNIMEGNITLQKCCFTLSLLLLIQNIEENEGLLIWLVCGNVCLSVRHHCCVLVLSGKKLS